MAATNIRELRELAGTEVKINISIEPIDGMTMDDYDFECMFYPFINNVEYKRKQVTLTKDKMIRIDENNYIAVVDTLLLGAGEIMVQITRKVPDMDCEDGLRTEIGAKTTGIVIH